MTISSLFYPNLSHHCHALNSLLCAEGDVCPFGGIGFWSESANAHLQPNLMPMLTCSLI